MTKKELRLIRNSITNTLDAIEFLACDNYPYTDFHDDYFRKIYYQLNDIAFSISKKIESCDEKAETV